MNSVLDENSKYWMMQVDRRWRISLEDDKKKVPQGHKPFREITGSKIKVLTVHCHESREEHALCLDVRIRKMIPVHENPWILVKITNQYNANVLVHFNNSKFSRLMIDWASNYILTSFSGMTMHVDIEEYSGLSLCRTLIWDCGSELGWRTGLEWSSALPLHLWLFTQFQLDYWDYVFKGMDPVVALTSLLWSSSLPTPILDVYYFWQCCICVWARTRRTCLVHPQWSTTGGKR